jgi:tRNA A-37 threonylcarbamoyl transferase component Bud32
MHSDHPLSNLTALLLKQVLENQENYLLLNKVRQQGSWLGKVVYFLHRRHFPTEQHLHYLKKTYITSIDTLLTKASCDYSANQSMALRGWMKMHNITLGGQWDKQRTVELTLINFTNTLQSSVEEALEPYTQKAMPWQQPSLANMPQDNPGKYLAALQLTEHLLNDFEELVAKTICGPQIICLTQLDRWETTAASLHRTVEAVRNSSITMENEDWQDWINALTRFTRRLCNDLSTWKDILAASEAHPTVLATLNAIDHLLAILETKESTMHWWEWLKACGFSVQQLSEQGATATVYKATHSESGKHYFLKRYHDPIGYSVWQKKDYGDRTATLEGPFSRILGSLASKAGIEAVVMTFIDHAQSLKMGKLRAGLTLVEKQEIFRKILAAVSILHKANLVNVDLKPANILLDKDNKVWVIDYGYQVRLSDEKPYSEKQHGTPLYTAPETLQGLTYNTSADIYSLGVIAYELFTEEVPIFYYEDPVNPVKNLEDKPASVNLSKTCRDMQRIRSQIREDLETIESLYLRDLVTQMLSEDPIERPTITQLEECFRYWAGQTKEKHEWKRKRAPYHLSI